MIGVLRLLIFNGRGGNELISSFKTTDWKKGKEKKRKADFFQKKRAWKRSPL